MGWEAGDLQLWWRPLSRVGGSGKGVQESSCARGAPCAHAQPGARQGSRACVCPVLRSRGGRTGTPRAHPEPRCTAKGSSASAARSAFLAALPRAGPAASFPPHPREMREMSPRSITARRTSPSPPASHGPAPAVLTPLRLTPIFFCLLFSLWVTHGCFCSAPRRHRERAQLPLL